jgi:CHAT domain-containing protein
MMFFIFRATAFDRVDPLSSGILLNNNKILTAKEIFNLKLNSGLIVLSACQTGFNKTRPGDELIGLTRAFIYAGTPSLIVSLWSVDAKSTEELMVEFYRSLKKGDDKVVALQQAQIKIMQKKGIHTHITGLLLFWVEIGNDKRRVFCSAVN